MRIAEIYASVQGEGEFVGTPSVFLRTTGCNLRCWFCDTPFTSWNPEGSHIELDALVATVRSFGVEHVVVTGGEPLLPVEIVEVTQRLRDAGHVITIETAGTVFRKVAVDLMSISPKLSNSTPTLQTSQRWSERHDRDRHHPEVVRQLMDLSAYQLKFVVDRLEDLTEIDAYLRLIPDVNRERVWLMPQAVTQEQLSTRSIWLKPLAEERGFRFSSRLHIEAYGNTRGT